MFYRVDSAVGELLPADIVKWFGLSSLICVTISLYWTPYFTYTLNVIECRSYSNICKTRYNWCIYFDKADHISAHPVKSRQGLNKLEYILTKSRPGWLPDLLAYYNSVYLLGFICNNSTSLWFHFLFHGGPIWTAIIIARAHYIFAVLHLWMMISPSLARRRHFSV